MTRYVRGVIRKVCSSRNENNAIREQSLFLLELEHIDWRGSVSYLVTLQVHNGIGIYLCR